MANSVGMRRVVRLLSGVVAGAALSGSLTVYADPFPPAWEGGSGAAVHYPPVAWPSEPSSPAECGATCGDWKPYTRFQNSLNDPRTQDPSNGGTSPQNYVNIASSCIDKDLPSIYYSLKQGATPDEDVLLFRWRVEQIANTYATGPNAGSFGSSHPWNSALWTVLFDIDGSGYRDLAAHLNGSSGSPSAPIDMLAGIYGRVPTQSINYGDDPNIFLLGHNPTAFTSGSTILNFQNRYPNEQPTTQWPNGSAETVWDYGTSRAIKVSTRSCTEYFIDYQIPIKLLDASGITAANGRPGPKITRSTPISMLFCTANSLNNPFQKDCAINRTWLADPNRPAPFGDYISFDQTEPYRQPIVREVIAIAPSAGSCNNGYELTAYVQDTLYVNAQGVVGTSLQSVGFYYYYDANGDGLVNDSGGEWIFASSAALKPGTLNTWIGSWNSSNLPKGRYLIGVQALDDRTRVDDGMPAGEFNHRTFSYLSPEVVDGLTPASGERWFGNPEVVGEQIATTGVDLTVNTCGVGPAIQKTVDTALVVAGGDVVFTLTVSNPAANPGPLSLTELKDVLPPGFSYKAGSTSGGFGSADPSVEGQALIWSDTVSIPPGQSVSLTFSAVAPNAVGTYSNTAQAQTSFGADPIVSEPVQITVGAARLSIAKTPGSYSSVPDAEITYTLSYRNDSPVNATGVIIADTLPVHLEYVEESCSSGCTWSSASRTLSWEVGNLEAGSGPFSVHFKARVVSPYAGPTSLVNTASIDSNETAPAEASTAVYIDTPRPALSLSKVANKTLVDPAGTAPANQVTFALNYANTGNAVATEVKISDPLPVGFTFVSATGSPSSAPAAGQNGTVEWTFSSLAAGASGTVTVTAQATNPYTGLNNPATNTASIQSDEVTSPVRSSVEVGVLQTGQQCSVYYFTDQPDIGVPLALEARLNPEGGEQVLSTAANALSSGAMTQFAQFYQEAAASSTVIFKNADGSTPAGVSITGAAYLSKSSQNPNVSVKFDIFDDVTGQLIATDTKSYTGNSGSKQSFALTVATPSGSPVQLTKDSRFRVVLSGQTQQAGQTNGVNLTINSYPENAATAGYVKICYPPPANLALNKAVSQVSLDSVGVARTLTYTLSYANTSNAQAATNAILEDVLPMAGVTYSACSVAGSSHFTRCTHDNGTLTFDSESGGVTIPAGASGSVTVTVSVADDLAGIPSLVNTAKIRSDQTSEQLATATTFVQSTSSSDAGEPNISIIKSAMPTLLVPGGEVEYTLTVVNTGNKTATAIEVSDLMPVTPYLTYQSGSISGGSTRDVAGNTLIWTIESLVPGASSQLKFRMQVASSGVPPGLTTHDNSASLTYQGGGNGTGTSNTVTVTTSTTPRLVLEKSAAPKSGLVPGDDISYSLKVSNTGSGAASTVRVVDPIPAGTRFKAITSGVGEGFFDAINNRVVFDLDALAAGASADFTFSVTLEESFSSGNTTVLNTATVSASNAASVSDSDSVVVSAAPDLQLTKSGPSGVAYPAAVLTTEANASTTLFVTTSAGLELGQKVKVGNAVVRIVGLSARTLTVDTPVTAGLSTPVVGALTFGLTYRNNGTAAASNVVLADTLPDGFGYEHAVPEPTGAPEAGSSGVVSWILGTLAAGASGSVQIEVFPMGSVLGALTNTAQITLAEADANPADNSAQASVSVGGLQVSKATSTPARKPGEVARYTITLTNSLSIPVTGVRVSDLLPAGFSYIPGSATVAGGEYAPNGGAADPVPTWSGLNVPASGTLEIAFDALVGGDVGSATYQNEVEVSAPAGVGVTPFDPLSTQDEDVTVLGNDVGLLDGVVFIDRNVNGIFDDGVDLLLPGVKVVIDDGQPDPYTLTTDGNGYYSQVLPEGGYTVRINDELLPSGAVALASGSSNPTAVTVPAGGQARDDTGFITSLMQTWTLSGTVFNDDGSGEGFAGDGIRNGSEAGTRAGGGLHVVVLDATNRVLMVSSVAADGGWSATVASGSGYTAYLSSSAPALGSTVTPDASLPSGWVVSGENDGVDNGQLTGIDASSADVSGLDFGIRSQGPDVFLTVDAPASVKAGDTVTALFAFGNQGTLIAEGVSYVLSLPVGVSEVVCAPLTCAHAPDTGVLTVSGLPDVLVPGQGVHVSVSYTAPQDGPLEVSGAIATSTAGDPLFNNTASASTAVSVSLIDVATWVEVPVKAIAGETVVAKVFFINLGGDEASGLVYRLEGLPAGTVVELNGQTCTVAGDGVLGACPLPTALGAGEQVKLDVRFAAPASGGVTLMSAVEAPGDANLDNNTASGTIAVVSVSLPDVYSTVSAPPTAIAASTVTATVTYGNLGPAVASVTGYELSLSAGLSGVHCTGSAACSYNAVTGVVTLSGLPATLAVGEQRVVSLSYTAPADSTIEVRSTLTAGGEVHLANNPAFASTVIGVAAKYSVTYQGNGHTGGSVPVDASSPYAAGSEVSVLGHGTLVRAKHVFAGWNTAADGSGITYAVAGTFSMPAANVVLYAQWTPQAADMAVSLSGFPTNAVQGSQVGGTVTCTNIGGQAATQAICQASGMPPGYTIDCSPAAPVASVAVGTSIVCGVSFTVPEPGTVTITGTTGADNDDNTANNIATQSVVVQAGAVPDPGPEPEPGPVSGQLTLVKTAYLGHDSGARCPGVKELVVVNKEREPVDITWCFVVTNTGETYLSGARFTDAPLGITPTRQDGLSLRSGVFPLAPGASAVWSYDDTRQSSLVNLVSVEMDVVSADGVPLPDGEPAVGEDSVPAIFGYVFDPPFGVKTGELLNGREVVRWTMVWINDNVVVARDVNITDPIPEGMTAIPGTLRCTAHGLTEVRQCAFEAPAVTHPRGRVNVLADFGPDAGKTTDTAVHKLEIAFDVTIDAPSQPRTYENQGKAEWDPDGEGGAEPFEAYTSDPLSDTPLAPTPIVVPPESDVHPIPGLGPMGGLLLVLGLGWLGWRQRVRGVGV